MDSLILSFCLLTELSSVAFSNCPFGLLALIYHAPLFQLLSAEFFEDAEGKSFIDKGTSSKLVLI